MQVGKGGVAGKGVHRAVLQGRLPGQAVLGGAALSPALAPSAKWREGDVDFTANSTDPRGQSHGHTWGFGPLGKGEMPLCGRGITEEVHGNWQAEVN